MPKPYVKMSTNYFVYHGDTDDGSTRDHNEDNFAIFESEQLVPGNGATKTPVYVALVADGIGGNASGEVASQLAVDNFVQRFQRLANEDNILTRLKNAVNFANNTIRDYTQANPQSEGMGTTIVVAAIVDNFLYIVHAGDSRAYLLRNNQLFQLTLDHTRVQDLLDNGHITVEQIEGRKDRHHITRYLGPAEEAEVDPRIIDIEGRTGDIRMPDQRKAAEYHRIQLQLGDTLLLCSDGLTDMVSDDQILDIVSKRNPMQATKELIRRANNNGGVDNITAIVLQRPAPLPPPPVDTPTVPDSRDLITTTNKKLSTLPIPILGWWFAALIAIIAVALGIILSLPKSLTTTSAPAEASTVTTEPDPNTATSLPPTIDDSTGAVAISPTTESAPAEASTVTTEPALNTATSLPPTIDNSTGAVAVSPTTESAPTEASTVTTEPALNTNTATSLPPTIGNPTAAPLLIQTNAPTVTMTVSPTVTLVGAPSTSHDTQQLAYTTPETPTATTTITTTFETSATHKFENPLPPINIPTATIRPNTPTRTPTPTDTSTTTPSPTKPLTPTMTLTPSPIIAKGGEISCTGNIDLLGSVELGEVESKGNELEFKWTLVPNSIVFTHFTDTLTNPTQYHFDIVWMESASTPLGQAKLLLNDNAVSLRSNTTLVTENVLQLGKVEGGKPLYWTVQFAIKNESCSGGYKLESFLAEPQSFTWNLPSEAPTIENNTNAGGSAG